MPGYDYETFLKDPMRRAEFLVFLSQFETVLSIEAKKPKKGEPVEPDVFKAGLQLDKDEKDRFLELIGGLRITLNGGTVEQTIVYNDDEAETGSYTCDFNRMVDYMRGRMVSLDDISQSVSKDKNGPTVFERIKTIPGADVFLEVIDMPERNTAGYCFDLYSDNQVYGGGYKGYNTKETAGITDNQIIAGTFALMEMSGGGENWRDVKINREKLEGVTADYVLMLDSTSGMINDMVKAPQEGAANIAFSLFSADPKAITGKFDEVYFSTIAPQNLEGMKDFFKRNPDANKNPEPYLPTVIQSALATDKPSRFNSYMDVVRQERKYRPVYEKFMEEQPEKAIELLKTKPEKLLDEIAPRAKTRIEELQRRIKKERDPDKKLRLAAEIIANRQLADVRRGGDGLENRPDPVQVEQRAKDLAEDMLQMSFNDPEATDELIAQATHGHGGKMMEAYEKQRYTYLDYINNLNLENPEKEDVAALAAATMLFVRQNHGAQAIAYRNEIDDLAVQIGRSPAFEKLMQDPATLQNAKVGFGLRITEQLRKITAELEAEKQAERAKRRAEREKAQEEIDLAQIEKDSKDPEHRKAVDRGFFQSLRGYGKATPFTEARRQKAQDYINTHPSCRAEALEIIQGNSRLQVLKVPKLRDVPDEQLVYPEKHKAALKKQQEAEKQKEAAKQGSAKTEPKKEAASRP